MQKGNCQRRPSKTSTFQVPCFLSLHICRVLLGQQLQQWQSTGYSRRVMSFVIVPLFGTTHMFSFLVATLLVTYGYWVTFPRVKRLGRGTDHPPPSCARVQSGYNYTCLPCVLSIVRSYSQDGGNNFLQNTMCVCVFLYIYIYIYIGVQIFGKNFNKSKFFSGRN